MRWTILPLPQPLPVAIRLNGRRGYGATGSAVTWPNLSPNENERLAELLNLQRRWTQSERSETYTLCNKASGIKMFDLSKFHPDGF